MFPLSDSLSICTIRYKAFNPVQAVYVRFSAKSKLSVRYSKVYFLFVWAAIQQLRNTRFTDSNRYKPLLTLLSVKSRYRCINNKSDKRKSYVPAKVKNHGLIYGIKKTFYLYFFINHLSRKILFIFQ